MSDAKQRSSQLPWRLNVNSSLRAHAPLRTKVAILSAQNGTLENRLLIAQIFDKLPSCNSQANSETTDEAYSPEQYQEPHTSFWGRGDEMFYLIPRFPQNSKLKSLFLLSLSL